MEVSILFLILKQQFVCHVNEARSKTIHFDNAACKSVSLLQVGLFFIQDVLPTSFKPAAVAPTRDTPSVCWLSHR